MTPKPDHNTTKASTPKPAIRKSAKGAAETARMFIDVNEVVRRTQKLTLSRYVE